MSENQQNPFTGVGKILFLTSLGLGCGGAYWVFVYELPKMPAGSYPIFYILGPIIIGAVLFFLGTTHLLRKKGIAVFVSERGDLERSKKAPPKDHEKQNKE
jgi:drug/metabolite transporter (DMT)-like permease